MSQKKIRRSSETKRKEPSVVHESSANSVQNIGSDDPIQAKKENASFHRRAHNGSDGSSNQGSGSNH